jgi:hypothetical protein
MLGHGGVGQRSRLRRRAGARYSQGSHGVFFGPPRTVPGTVDVTVSSQTTPCSAATAPSEIVDTSNAEILKFLHLRNCRILSSGSPNSSLRQSLPSPCNAPFFVDSSFFVQSSHMQCKLVHTISAFTSSVRIGFCCVLCRHLFVTWPH